MSERIKISFKGIPIHICDKAPKDKPILLSKAFGNVCPFCGEKMSEQQNQTPKRHGSPTFYAMLDEMADIHDKKSHDYANNDNPYGNYLFAGTIATMFAHSSLDAGFASRLAEKMYRLSVLEGGHKTPKNESIDDTERDIATITALWMAARRDSRLKQLTIREDNDLELYVIKNEGQYDVLMLERTVSYLQACIDARRKNAQDSKTT